MLGRGPACTKRQPLPAMIAARHRFKREILTPSSFRDLGCNPRQGHARKGRCVNPTGQTSRYDHQEVSRSYSRALASWVLDRVSHFAPMGVRPSSKLGVALSYGQGRRHLNRSSGARNRRGPPLVEQSAGQPRSMRSGSLNRARLPAPFGEQPKPCSEEGVYRAGLRPFRRCGRTDTPVSEFGADS